jgi:hypothetical protein
MTALGFTADVTLYKASGRYRVTVGPASGFYAEQVRPQLSIRRNGADGCIPGCICVSPIGCPCCDSLFPTPISPIGWGNGTAQSSLL